MKKHLFMTEEQKEIIGLAKQILDKELKPRVRELEEIGEFPMDVFQKMYEAGLYGIEIPEKYGGMGASFETSFMLNEEMAWYEPGFAFAFRLGSGVTNSIFLSGSEELKERAAKMILDGKIGAFCLTEAEAGSDAGAIRTTAVRDGDDYIINGTKTFISNGGIADFFVVAATLDRDLKHKGITLFLIEKERGVIIGKREDKMGLKLSITNELVFDNVRIPASNLIGKEGEGFRLAMQDMESVRPGCMMYAVGLSQRALDEAVAYAKVRKTFGEPIINYQGVSFILADMQKKVHMCRASLMQIARALDHGLPLHGYGSSAKTFVSDSAMEITTDAVQILGGYGYMKDYPVEKLMRDAKIFQIFEGTNQIQNVVLAGMLAR